MKNNTLSFPRLLALGLVILSFENAFAVDDDAMKNEDVEPALILVREPDAEINSTETAPERAPADMTLSQTEMLIFLTTLASNDHTAVAALANQYIHGTHGRKNSSVANTLMIKAMALMINEGLINTKGYAEAKTGDPIAQYNFGITLINSNKGSFWTEKGYEWLLKSAAQEYAPALNNLGCAYLDGVPYTFITCDPTQAVSYFERAADKGSIDAHFNLALCYAKGLGVEQSDEKAKELCIWAASEGFEPAIELLTFMDENDRQSNS